MKKAVLVLAILILAIIACIDKKTKDEKVAQLKETEISPTKVVADTDTTHLQFLGINIDGDVKDFEDKILARGFTRKKGEFIGEFAGRKCRIDTNEGSLVALVYVLFEGKHTRWSDLKSDYQSVIDMYTEKYGKPYGSAMEFERSYKEGDGYELLALKSGKLDMSTAWLTPKGMIVVKATNDAEIIVTYADMINYGIMENQKNKKAKSEI